MPDTNATPKAITPLAWKDRPALIEHTFAPQKISAEAQKERKANVGQTLTALGSYWKGRKPLILAKACILGALLPATDDTEADLAVFEKLMAIDDDAFRRRVKSRKDAERITTLPYAERLALCYRPEEVDDQALYGPVWDEVNAHLGTDAHGFPELMEQIGTLRFGHRPKVGDTFCGGGSIPFEAARLGCDVYASDLNPIACMLTWGALNIIGADAKARAEIARAQRQVAEAVDREITALGIEHDAHGNRAKAYLYCLETRCPQTGWMVPLAPSWVISSDRRAIARLVPDPANKRFAIDILTGVSEAEMAEAAKGTVRDGDLVYTLDEEEYRTPIKTIRGDYRLPDGTTGNRLRRWELHDFKPRPDDIFQERLYCIQWITKESLGKGRQQTFFAAVTGEDQEREANVEAIVAENLVRWQAEGLVPDMPIEPGDETTRLGRERGWTYWHHLFSPRHLVIMSPIKRHSNYPGLFLDFCQRLNITSKLCMINSSKGQGGAVKYDHVFHNQALNTLLNYGQRGCTSVLANGEINYPHSPLRVSADVKTALADSIEKSAELWITDPPYADAINYHEITEFFIAWLRKNPPEPFRDWIWDSRRALAIKGRDAGFRKGMVEAYRAMAAHMPDNGLQIVMFTHQDAGVWADMAEIMWGAGLRVTAAWYVATETTSELKKGGYVQGTVLLVLRKRLGCDSAYKDELMQELKAEVARQIDTMTGLNQRLKGLGRIENLFEDADLQMAGYAAALRVLTGYARIDGIDMTAEALRPRKRGEKGVVGEIIDFAVQVANEHLVPEGLTAAVWERLSGPERFYLKMLDIETTGAKKLDSYQNFAKAFRVADYGALMGAMKPNAARLKTAYEFKRSEFGDTGFGASLTRAVLYALYELQRETDVDEVLGQLRDLIKGYYARRDDVIAIVRYLGQKREKAVPAEAEAARILAARIQSERLG
ncbi:conserved hypothetical protein [Candidatus Defluviicoccus seviourii]|uniref:DUF1156 domain-containing protein n=2 Tax=root TaxID=1 RepID=A0A564WET6_9PROT|nr:conserved hypothetical protein [uncultured Defluviicoccus sp.]VUX46992.1 conserved hypothetical protein [Candidatus Defluviicoccus seviourii]